ncbi:MAG: FlgD immunoglobulin-like domain containing protein, partial [Planctomycetota bacterium]
MKWLALAVALSLSIPADAATYEAPRRVRETAEATFAKEPSATAVRGGVRISFELSAPTDVEVAILDAKGRIVRHLKAGVPGKADLEQKVTWDGKDDRGRPAKGGPFTARVRIGSTPKLEQYVGWDGNTLGARIVGLAVSPKGEVYALFASGHGRTALRVFDKTGKYARTIIPYPAETPGERTTPVGTLEVGGERIPAVFNAHGGNTVPLTAGMKPQSMAWHPDGHLLVASAVGTISSHRPPRYVLALHPEGGAPPETGLVGPQIRGLADRGIGFMGGAGEHGSRWFTHLATSPDGEYMYVTDSPRSYACKIRHCVYRLKWTDRTPGPPRRGEKYRDHGPDDLAEPFLGEFRKPGDDDTHLNDPQGLGTDKDGNLYVCDYGNNRVIVFDRDKKAIAKWGVEKPLQIAVHPKTGQIYVLSGDPFSRRSKFQPVLRKFAPLGKAEEPPLVASLKGRFGLMALDPSADPPKLWVIADGLRPVVDRGEKLVLGEAVNNHDGVKYPGFVSGDPERHRLLYREMQTGMGHRPIRTIDLRTGEKKEFLKGTDTALDADGNIYVMGWWGTDAMFRYTPDGRPLPFKETGSHKLPTGQWSSYGPNIGIRGHCVGPDGNIYMVRSSNKWGGKLTRVDVFSPEGKKIRPDLVDGLTAGDCGVGVDAAGNIYVGINAKPKDHPLPAWFRGVAPAKHWNWWRYDRQGKREVPWAYPYQNPYLNHQGAVFKFGPDGGKVYGFASKPRAKKGEPKPPTPVLVDPKNAPADAPVYWSGNLKKQAKITGAVWRYGGVGPIPALDFGWGDPGCICWNSRLAVDPYGRVFAPNVFLFCVEMLDTDGNRIGRIGSYGNSDDGLGDEPRIAFAWPAYV